MKLGVVIATLNEEAELAATLDRLLPQAPDEVIVVDGGSQDGTRRIAAGRTRWLDSLPGRARQLNAGARALRSEVDVLVFLHADCHLGGGSLVAIRTALRDPRVAGGGFHKRFRSGHPLLRHGHRARTHLWHRFGYVLGDQAQFIRATSFARLGGFREDVLAEDMDLSLRMGLEGECVLLEPEALISARRLERDGILLTWARWWWITQSQGLRAAWEGPRRGALSLEPTACRDSSSAG